MTMQNTIPIRWTYTIKENLSPKENIKNLLTIAGVSSLELITKEPLNENPGHCYSIHSVSMIGEPEYVNQKLRSSCDSFKEYLINYANNEFPLEEKLWQFDEVEYLIEKYLLENDETGCFLPELPHTLVLNSLSDNQSKDVIPGDLDLRVEHYELIRQHLSIRSSHLKILRNFVVLHRKKLVMDSQHYSFVNPQEDIPKESDLLEIWIALQQLGYLDHVKQRSPKMAKLRADFFKVFRLSETNNKKIREQLLETKNPSARLLPKLEAAFMEVAKKYM